MISLNLPRFDIKIVSRNNRLYVYDVLRHKFVTLTPEEWVRQHFCHHLTHDLGYPAALIGNEITITVGEAVRRCDTIVYQRSGGAPQVVVEYKAPHVEITQATFNQIAAYNSVLHADYLIVSNGLQHFCCKMDYTQHSFYYLQQIPHYSAL